MRKVLSSATLEDQSALRVVAAFDEAVLDTSDLDVLADVAVSLTGHRVGVRDLWNDRHTARGYDDAASDATDVPRAAVAARIRGRDAQLMTVDARTILVSSVEIAMGTVGYCWLEPAVPDVTFAATDYLVVERLARSVASVALQERNQRSAMAWVEEGAIERLLQGPLTELELAELARTARLPVDREVRAIALDQTPHNGVSPVALAEDLLRRFAGNADGTRVAALPSMVAVLTTDVDGATDILESAAAHYANLKITLRAGLGSAGSLEHAHLSWRQAREALALHGLASRQSPVLDYGDLGAFMLLSCIDEQRLLESPLYCRMTDGLVDSRTPSLLDLLEVFLDEGSLRKTAARVYLHHTTVESRVRQIEEILDVDLSDQRMRFELQLLIKTARVINAKARY